MNDLEVIEILLVEDSDADAEMTMRALKKGKVTNKVMWVKDGVEALEFIQCTGAYSQRDRRHPKYPDAPGSDADLVCRRAGRRGELPRGCQQLPGETGGFRGIRRGRGSRRSFLGAHEQGTQLMLSTERQ